MDNDTLIMSTVRYLKEIGVFDGAPVTNKSLSILVDAYGRLGHHLGPQQWVQREFYKVGCVLVVYG